MTFPDCVSLNFQKQLLPFVFSFTHFSLKADFSDNFNKIISCPSSLFDRHLLWLDSRFGFGDRAFKKKPQIDVVFCVWTSRRGPKSFLSFKMPENANIAKKNHQQPYCSLCLAFALLSTEYALPFCSWMPNSSSTQIIDRVLTTTVEHVTVTLLCCQTQPDSEARKECQILASVQPIFWNLTYEMHFGLVCFHLVPLSISSTCVQCALNAFLARLFSNSLSPFSSQNRWLTSSRERGE